MPRDAITVTLTWECPCDGEERLYVRSIINDYEDEECFFTAIRELHRKALHSIKTHKAANDTRPV